MNTTPNVYGRALEGVLLAAVFLGPLIFSYPWTPFDGGNLKTTTLNLAAMIVLGLWVMESLAAGRVVWRRSPLDWPVAAFLLWNLLSVAWTRYPYAVLTQFGHYCTYAAVCFAVITHLASPKQLLRLLAVALVSTGLVCAYGVAQLHGYDFVTWAKPDLRLSSTLGNATFLAAHLVLLLPLVINLTLVEGPLLRRLTLAALAGLMGFTLLVTYTRAAWLGLLAALALDVVLLARYAGWGRSERRVVWLRGGGLALALALALGLGAWRGPYPLAQRFASSFTMDMSNVQRTLTWKGTWRLFAAHPLLGTGAGTLLLHLADYLDPEFYTTGVVDDVEHAHNEFLELASDTGVIGLGLFLWLLGAFAATARRVIRRGPTRLDRLLAAGALCGAFAFLAQNMAGVSLRQTAGAQFFWLVLGLAGALWVQAEGVAALPAPRSLNRLLRTSAGAVLAVVMFFAGWAILNRTFSDLAHSAGAHAFRTGHPELARGSLLAAVQLNPYSFRAYHQLGVFHIDQEEWPEARRALERARALGANYAKMHQALATVYDALGLTQEAVVAYETDARMRRSPDALIALAEAYRRAERPQDARRAADEALALLEQGYTHRVMPEDVYVRHAMIVGPQGAREAALRDLRRAQDLRPDSDKPRLARADLYRLWGEYRQAIQEYKAAIAINPQNPEPYGFMGACYASLGELEPAVTAYHTALFIRPGDAYTRLNLGLALRALGRKDEARTELERVERLGPGNPLAVQAHAALQELRAQP